MKLSSSKIVTTLFILTFALASNAKNQRFRIGLKFAGNASWYTPSTKNIERVGSSLGYSYGIMADYNFAKYYAFAGELLFSDIAGSISYKSLTYAQVNPPTNHTNVQYDYRMKYVEIPLSLKFKTKELGYWTYWAQFGVAPGFMTQAVADISGQDLPTTEEFNDPTDIRVNQKSNDGYHFSGTDDAVFPVRLPLIMGAGIEYSLAGNTALYAGFRMANDFLNSFPSAGETIAKNKSASLKVGIFF